MDPCTPSLKTVYSICVGPKLLQMEFVGSTVNTETTPSVLTAEQSSPPAQFRDPRTIWCTGEEEVSNCVEGKRIVFGQVVKS